MQVIKRSGKLEEVKFDKVTARIKHFCYNLDSSIDPIEISQKVCSRIHNNITTSELDDLTSEICIGMAIKNPDYSKLSSRITVDNHQKNTDEKFSIIVEKLYKNEDILGEKCPLINEEIHILVQENIEKIDDIIDHKRDFDIDYFGFKTLLKSYLLKVNKKVVERPQHLWLRVALGIHHDDLEKVEQTYDMLSQKFFMHATPTLFNAGTPCPQMSSCYLTGTEDSIEGIYKNITDCAKISKWAGGLGVHISNIRSNGSYIRKTGGTSSGILPMLKVYNDTARYVNQAGKRLGSFAMYLEPWHADVFQFLEAKKNHGAEEERARDLFYALWIPDLFMKRVENDEVWSLMCPDQSKNLNNYYGEEFESLYESYEKDGKYVKQIKARKLWNAIIDSQIETGTPYMLYKDSVNRKSNQKNIGTIRSSNLCTEIMEYSDEKEYAVCNLGSINLSKFVKKTSQKVLVYSKSGCKYCDLAKKFLSENDIPFETEILDDKNKRLELYMTIEDDEEEFVNTMPQIYIDGSWIGGFENLCNYFNSPDRFEFDFEKLYEITTILTNNLNIIIDKNFYPVPETKISNLKHRPIGIGVQGLADMFIKMRLPFESEEAKKLNKYIFEVIYYASLTESLELSKRDGAYSTFKGSPMSEGLFQFNLWDENPELSGMFDWNLLRKDIQMFGIRNSLLIAPMPTASTAQILGNNESIEPYTSNIYTRRTLAGEFTVINKHLIRDLVGIGLWNEEVRNKLMYFRGSIQNIQEIPKFIKDLYKTAWEIKQRCIIDMSADRGRFICQSQSLNIFVANPTYKILTSIHFHGWKSGLKTGSYYIRTKPAANSQSFTIDPDVEKKIRGEYEETNYHVCENCSS